MASSDVLRIIGWNGESLNEWMQTKITMGKGRLNIKFSVQIVHARIRLIISILLEESRFISADVQIRILINSSNALHGVPKRIMGERQECCVTNMLIG